MLTKKEFDLKKLFVKEEEIRKEIGELTNKLLLSASISVWKHPLNFEEILYALKTFLNCNSYKWFEITISSLNVANQFDCFPMGNFPFRIYLFGEKRFILQNIEKIVDLIVHGHRKKMEKAIISWRKTSSIKDFI